jgi:hypothetical protein
MINMLDFVILISSVFLGSLSSLFIYLRHEQKKRNRINLSSDAKSYLDNILFEKSLALEAIGRINDFFKEKKLDLHERDRLLMKYNNLLDYYDRQILKFSPILEAEDLYECRNQIVSAIATSIDKLDRKLGSLSSSINLTPNIEGDKIDLSPVSSSLFTNGLMQETSMKNGNNKDYDAISKDYNVAPVNPSKTVENLDYLGNVANSEQDHVNKISLDDYGEEYLNANSSNYDDDFNKVQLDILNTLKRLENHDT